jgi:hypothetical protein
MRLDLEQRAVVDAVTTEAHAEVSDAEGRYKSTDLARAVVRKLHDLEGAGQGWVTEWIDHLAVEGCKDELAAWKKRNPLEVHTAKGTPVTVPATTGIRTAGPDGRQAWVQVPFASISLTEARSRRTKVARTRNTYSKEVRFYDDLIAVMEQDPTIANTGEALAELERRAS